MGDSRIRISLILPKSAPSKSTHTHDTDDATTKIQDAITLPADSTLRTVVNHIIENMIQPNSSPSASSQRNDSDGNKNDLKSFFGEADESSKEASSSKQSAKYLVYDCTNNPMKELNSTILSNPNQTGPQSKTLQHLGWFPSGNLLICHSDIHDVVMMQRDKERSGDTLDQWDNLDDTNQLQQEAKNTSTNKKNGDGRLLPSQMMNAITKRFEPPEGTTSNSASGSTIPNTDESNDVNEALEARQKLKQRRDMKQERRTNTLSERLTRINALISKQQEQQENSTSKKKRKKKNVSQQVRKMLIKSKSEGDGKLRAEDRFYLETVLVLDANDVEIKTSNCNDTNKKDMVVISSSHKFYSKMVNVGRVATSIANSLPLKNETQRDRLTSELLVILSKEHQGKDVGSGGESSSDVYRRLPNTMHLYEAESSGHLQNFDRVVIRVFPVGEDATPNVKS